MGSSVPIIGKWATLTVIGNSGGAFGLFQSFTGLLIITSAVFVLTVVFFVRNKRGLPFLMMIGLSLLLGGSLSNLIDRIRYGYVVDFISIWIWPVFNMADVAIVFGMVFFAYFVVFQDGKKQQIADREDSH